MRDPRKFFFWMTVVGVAALTPFGLRLAAEKIPSQGIKQLVTYINSAPGGSQ
jgi:hypothetical protein